MAKKKWDEMTADEKIEKLQKSLQKLNKKREGEYDFILANLSDLERRLRRLERNK